MTTYEHFMLSITYGATLGLVIGGLLIMVRGAIDDIKARRKAKREQKLSGKETDNM